MDVVPTRVEAPAEDETSGRARLADRFTLGQAVLDEAAGVAVVGSDKSEAVMRVVCPETGRARLSYRRAEEIFDENIRLLANPLASPEEDTEDLDGWTLHRLRHSAQTHSTPMLLARFRHASARSQERYARPSVDAVARHVADRDPTARRKR